MNRIEGFKVANRGSYTARMNQLYHTNLTWWFGVTDRCLRIIVGILAVTSAVLAQSDHSGWGFGLAMFTALMAVVLNVLPVGEWEKNHLDLFRRWSNVRRQWERMEMSISSITDITKDLTKPVVEEMNELNAEKLRIESDEPAASRKYVSRCQKQVVQSLMGSKSPDEYMRHKIEQVFGAAQFDVRDAEEEVVTADC